MNKHLYGIYTPTEEEKVRWAAQRAVRQETLNALNEFAVAQVKSPIRNINRKILTMLLASDKL